MGKRKSYDSNDSDSDGSSSSLERHGEVYVVELIAEAFVDDDKKARYLVRWDGYDRIADSWEPEENVIDCKRLLKSFWQEFKLTYKRGKSIGEVGKTYTPSDAWIEKELAFFRNSIRKEKEKKKVKHKKAKLSEKRKLSPRREDLSKLFADETTSQRPAGPSSLFSGSDSDDSLPPLSSIRGKGKGKEKTIDKEKSDVGVKIGDSLKRVSTYPGKPTENRMPNPRNKFAGMKITKSKTSLPPGSRPLPGSSNPSAVLASSSKSAIPGEAQSRTNERNVQKQDIPRPVPSISAYRRPSNDTSQSMNSPNLVITPRPYGASSNSPVLPSDPAKASDEASTNFLATFLPFGISEPQMPGAALMSNRQNKQALSDLKFEKKRIWHGELFLDYSDAAERICDIHITQTFQPDPTQPSQRLSTILDSKESLRLSKVYRSSELNIILRSVKKVDQMAVVQYYNSSDKRAFETFVKYLSKADVIAATPAVSTYGRIGEMIIFASTNENMCKRLQVPPQLAQPGDLILALMPCHVMPSIYVNLRPDEIKDPQQDTMSSEMTNRAKIIDAIQILNFPAWFLGWLTNRRYAIWMPCKGPPFKRGTILPVDSNFSRHGSEDMLALVRLLKYFKCENVALNGGVRIVFVHVAAIGTAHQISSLAQWRCERPDIRFVTFGRHECIRPMYWGFSEIWTLGGIITFTANALLDDLMGVEQLIRQIDKHPLWTCYIHPNVLSVFIRMSCPGGDDPVSLFMREPYCFGRILDLIREGKVALTRCPDPLDRDPVGGADPNTSLDWIDAQLSQLEKMPRDHVEDSYSTYVAEYSNKMEKEATEHIESELARDCQSLHAQPGIREHYRRFIIIKGSRDSPRKPYDDAIEWMALQEFDFKDAFQSSTAELDF